MHSPESPERAWAPPGSSLDGHRVSRITAHCIIGDMHSVEVIPCGRTSKTFKWLGLTAAARYSAKAPHGMRRRRELRTSCRGPERLLPLRVSRGTPEDVDVTFLHPDAFLEDYLVDGDNVTVMLGTAMPVNERGVPLQSNWATVAFSRSVGQAGKREEALEAEKALAEERERRKYEAERALRAKEEAQKANLMRGIIKSKLQDESEVTKSFSEDYNKLSSNSDYERLFRSPGSQRRVKEALREAYLSLSEVFKTYAAAGSGIGTAHELEQNEFSALFHDCDIFNLGTHLMDVVYTIFEMCKAKMGGEAMDQSGFMGAMVFVAWLKYVDGGHGDGVLSRKVPRQRVDPFADRDMPIEVAFNKLMTDVLEPFIRRTMYGTVVKAAMNTDEVLAMFYDRLENLNSLFMHYASAASPEELMAGATESNAMTLSEFVSLIEDSGLVGGVDAADQNDELTLKEVRQAFSAAQGDHEDAPSGGGRASSTPIAHSQKMDFPEFIEAIVRIGCLKWEKSEMPVPMKVETACQAIVQVPIPVKLSGRK